MSSEKEKIVFSIRIGRRRLRMLALVFCGAVFLAIVAARTGVAQAALDYVTGHNASVTGPVLPATHSKYSEHEVEYIQGQPPQEQAERLLQAAMNRDEGATDLIEKLSPGWYGKIKLTKSLSTFEVSAMNANDVRVRAAAIETHLASANLVKNPATVTALIHDAETNLTHRPTDAYLLGMLANRGVQPERVHEWLLTWSREPESRSRIAVVQALAILANDDAVSDLLQILRLDEDAGVRAEAAHSIARTGMLTEQQRWHAVPELIQMTPGMANPGRHEVFDALREITGKTDLPDDNAAWQTWWSEQTETPHNQS